MPNGFALPEPTDDRDHRREVALRITPAPGRVVLLPIDAESKTEGGLYLPGAEQEKTALAEVISVGGSGFGPMDMMVPTPTYSLKVGQTVLYQLYQPIVYEIDGVKVYVIKQEYIDGVLDAETPA